MTQPVQDPAWMQGLDDIDRRELDYAALYAAMEKPPITAEGPAYNTIMKLRKKLENQAKAHAKKAARSAGAETESDWMASLTDERYRKTVIRAQDYAEDPFGAAAHLENLTIAALVALLDEQAETIARLKTKGK